MASQPQPGSIPRAASAYTSCVQGCVELFDWWPERVEGEEGKIRVAGVTTRNRAGRVFTSNSITKRHADCTLEAADDVTILIMGPLNISRMLENGFPLEVCKLFQLGFPVEWEKRCNSNMKQTNDHTRSPSKSTEYYLDKFLHGNFINSMPYAFKGNNFESSKGPTSNMDKCSIQRPSNHISSEFEECETPEWDKALLHPWTEDALPTKAMNPQFGAVQHSEDNTIRRLRNGKVFGISSAASLQKQDYKRKCMQNETSNRKMASHGNVGSPKKSARRRNR